MHYNTLSAAILALTKSHYNAGANLVYCVSLFSLIPLGFHFFGMLGAVVAADVGDVPVYFVVLYGAFREKVDTLLQYALPTVAFVMTFGRCTGPAGGERVRFGQPFQGIHWPH